MTYSELMKLVNEYGLKYEHYRLTYKDYIIANVYDNLIFPQLEQIPSDNKTRETAYCLKFSGYYDTMIYELAKKYTEDRIKLVKEMIIRNKKAELEEDFE